MKNLHISVVQVSITKVAIPLIAVAVGIRNTPAIIKVLVAAILPFLGPV